MLCSRKLSHTHKPNVAMKKKNLLICARVFFRRWRCYCGCCCHFCGWSLFNFWFDSVFFFKVSSGRLCDFPFQIASWNRREKRNALFHYQQLEKETHKCLFYWSRICMEFFLGNVLSSVVFICFFFLNKCSFFSWSFLTLFLWSHLTYCSKRIWTTNWRILKFSVA